MFVTHKYIPIFHIEPDLWRTVVGISLAIVSIVITVWHKRLFQKAETNVNTFDNPDKLIENGLFKYIRNPMYLGFTSSLAALALLAGALTPWFIVIGFFLLADRWYIPFEEKLMRERFGSIYDEYQLRTRRWI
jgi:protein-S-isoprenylcysteine O-methyltransferase Ste14